MIVLVVLLLAAWVIVELVDLNKASSVRKDLQGLIDNPNLAPADRTEIVKTISRGAGGTKGLSRILVTLTVLTIVAGSLFALLSSSAADAPDLRKTVVTSLLSVLATIIGFYFGTRAAESGQTPSSSTAPTAADTTTADTTTADTTTADSPPIGGDES